VPVKLKAPTKQIFQVRHNTQEFKSLENAALEVLLEQFSDCFAEPTELPPCRPEDIAIETTGKIPKSRGIGKCSQTELDFLRKQLEDMLERGHIQPSTSPYAASVLFVKKQDGSLRMVVDYR
jgi:hypothetical protein